MTISLFKAKRKDKDSHEAYYDIDLGSPDGIVTIKDGKIPYKWQRKISNENIIQKGFSFYLARYAFGDKYNIFDFDLGSDPKNTGILGMSSEDTKKLILIYVDNIALNKGIIYIVSASYVTNEKLIERYNNTKRMQIFFEDKMSSKKELAKLARHVRKINKKHFRKLNKTI